MRIILDIESLRHTRTGLTQYTYQLICGLNEILTDDKVVLLNNSLSRGKERKPYLPPIDNSKCQYKNFKISKKLLMPLWHSIGVPRLEHLIGRFSVYHAPTHNRLPLTRAMKILTIHDLSHKKGAFQSEAFTQELNRYFPQAAKWADIIIADSESTRNDIVEFLHVDENKVVTVHLAASNWARYIEDKSVIKNIRKKYGIDRDYMLFVGSIEPRKNIANIIRAYNIYSNMQEDALLLVLCGGKGWMNEEIFKEFESSEYRKKIIFTGFVDEDDLAYMYNGASFFIYPSLYEGFGIPILEAMACGVPVITSNVSSLPEVAGDAAILISPRNVEELADSMLRLTNSASLREDMREKGLLQIRKFSWRRCAQETLSVYKSRI